MEPSDFGPTLHNLVTTSTSVEHLFKLLQFVDLDELKEFAHQQIDKMDKDILRAAHHTTISVNQIIPRDAMQNILSFRYCYFRSPPMVCKPWNALYKLNQENMLRSVYQKVADQYPDKLPQRNKTWVMHYDRNRLHPIEQRLGFQGPLNSIDAAVQRCKSGDRVLVHETFYHGETSKCVEIDKDLHFIGLFPLKKERCRIPMIPNILSHVILDNLLVKDCVYYIGGAKAERANNDCKLTIRNCKLQGKYSMHHYMETFVLRVRDRATLEMENCEMWTKLPRYESRTQKRIPVAIEISPFAKAVNVDHCTIRSFQKGIVIQRDRSRNSEPDALVEINIKNTVFEDISDFAVVESGIYPPATSEGNFIKRCNLLGNISSPELPDCNTLHQLIAPFVDSD